MTIYILYLTNIISNILIDYIIYYPNKYVYVLIRETTLKRNNIHNWVKALILSKLDFEILTNIIDIFLIKIMFILSMIRILTNF